MLELDGGLGDHVLGGEDRRAGADSEGEGVGGPRVDRDLATVQLEVVGADVTEASTADDAPITSRTAAAISSGITGSM